MSKINRCINDIMSSSSRGYPVEIFRSAEVNEKFLCVLCHLILRNAVQRYCGHRYCRDCCDAVVAADMACPACEREGVEEEQLDDVGPQVFNDFAIRREMNTLNVVCCHPSCNWTGLFKDFVDHYETHSVPEEANLCRFGCGKNLTDVTNAQEVNDHLLGDLPEHMNVIFDKLKLLQDKLGEMPAGSRNDSIFSRMNELERKFSSLQLESAKTDDRMANAATAASAGAGRASASNDVTADTVGNMTVFEGVITVLNRELEKMTVDMDELQRQRRLERELMDNLDRKARSMERLIAMKDATINELNIRVTSLEQTSYDGTLLWRVSEIQKKKQEAVSGRVTSVYSSPFFTSRTGYKMCLRMYLNGDGMGKGSHLSVFFVVMRGSFDALLPWPFRQKVTLMLLSQNQREHVVDAFRPDPTSSSFKRPTTEMNIASGCPLFASLEVLDNPSSGYVKEDQLFLKAVVDCSGLPQ